MPAHSLAGTLTGTSRTYLQSRETVDNSRILGGYEYLDFVMQNDNETISFHTGGWLRYDFKDEQFGSKTNNDLQYSYLSFKSKTDNAIVNLGRVMVFEGVAAERVDGLYARTDLLYNFGISVFGGMPVETIRETPGNNQIYGTRLSHQVAGLYTAGVSYVTEEKNDKESREQAGIDFWFHPFDKVEVAGRSNYNYITRNWMENSYNLVLGPFERLRFTTEASWIDYKDYFTGATTTAFRLGHGVLDWNEGFRRLSEKVSYGVTDKLNVAVNYTNYDYKLAGSADSYGANAQYAVAQGKGVGLAYQRMDGETTRLQYTEYRVYGYTNIYKLNLTLDLLNVKYDTSINEVTNSWSASAAAQYGITRNLSVGADIEYLKSPDFDKDVRAFVKAVYRFDAPLRVTEGSLI
jgi:hypothetical protein